MRSIEIEQENAEGEILELLIESDLLEGAALGIAKQVLNKGMEILREKQEYISVSIHFRECEDLRLQSRWSLLHLPAPDL